MRAALATVLLLGASCAPAADVGILESQNGTVHFVGSDARGSREDKEGFTYLNIAVFEPNVGSLSVGLRYRMDESGPVDTQGDFRLIVGHHIVCKFLGSFVPKSATLDVTKTRLLNARIDVMASKCRTGEPETLPMSIRLTDIPLSENPDLVRNLRGAVEQFPKNYPVASTWFTTVPEHATPSN